MNEEYSAKLFEELKEIKKEIKELRSLNECKYLGFCETAKYLGVSYYTVMNDWKSWIKYGVSPSKYKKFNREDLDKLMKKGKIVSCE